MKIGARLVAKGRITISLLIRRRLGLEPSQVLEVDEDAPYVLAVPVFDERHASAGGLPGKASSNSPLTRCSLFTALEAEGKMGTTNRASAQGDLANVIKHLGRIPEALSVAEESLELHRSREDVPAAVQTEGQIAQILKTQGRYTEAEERYRRALEGAESVGDDELIGLLWQSIGNMAVERHRPEQAEEPLRKALAAFLRAGDDRGRMRAYISLGNLETLRGRGEAALEWYEQGLLQAESLADVVGQAAARSGWGQLLSNLALEADDPGEHERLLIAAIAEQREVLALAEQLGQPPSVAISHNNLSESLRRIGQLDEAELHAREAMEIWELLNSPKLWTALWILERIAEAKGDAMARAEWRRRREAAQAAPQLQVGPDALPQELVGYLLQRAVTALAQKLPLAETLRADGVERAGAFLALLE